MRKQLSEILLQCRVINGPYASKRGDDYGAFLIMGPCGALLKILCSGTDAENGWEHVSVSRDKHPPNWQEMCFVKKLFWGDDEAVMQLHPPSRDYVNHHPNCLHLWRPLRDAIPLPPSILVGPKG